jgi:predicted Zn-dependent peptidase
MIHVEDMYIMVFNYLFCRFEAHMEVHVGSIDEEEDEQGIAHMIEHVAFLGSKKREKLLGTGARSNAYTDFHHTVFHIHSPTKTKVFTYLSLSSFSFLCQSSKCPFFNWK